jgi:hypothetical protein
VTENREREFWEIEDEEPEEAPLPAPPRAPAWLAVMRIVCVLGMSFGISFGLFLLLLPSIWGVVSLLSAIPFFVVMRYMERFALDHAPEEVTQDQQPT